MSNRRSPSLALPVLALFAPFAQAGDDGLELRLQTTMLPPIRVAEATPAFITADRMEGHQGAEMEAHGNAVLRKRGQAVFGEHLTYLEPDDEVRARERVRVEQGSDVVMGSELRLKLDTREGYLEPARFWLVEQGAHGDADRLLFQGQDKYGLTRARYTTCGPESEDWFLRAGELEIDRTTQIGTARHARIEFMGVPLLYSPWMSFPLTDQRKSGLLTPTFGGTSNSGFLLAVPFYWNIAPNRDATITPRYLSKRGLQMVGEFRYLDPRYSGQVDAESLQNDRVAGESRHALLWRHRQEIAPGWLGNLNIQRVSDDAYYRDLSSQIAVTSQTNLPREGTLTYVGNGMGFSARVQRFQTLQDPSAPIVPPYQRVPQLTLAASRPNVYGATLAANSEFVAFGHPDMVNGKRFTLYPSASLPMSRLFGFLTPKFGVHHTSYALDDNNTAGLPNASRTLPIFSLDSGVFFEREGEFRDAPFIQTLEPRLYYLYVPYRDQSRMPVFDSAEADFNYAQMFSENQFIGGDRINDANQLTAAVTSRLLDPATGLERLRGAIGQRYYFKDQQVTLTSPARNDTASDIVAVLGGRPAAGWLLDGGLQYSQSQNRAEKINFSARYNPSRGKALNFSYRDTRAVLRQIDVSAQWQIHGGWQALARWNYSLLDSRLLEGLAGLEYNGGCWAARAVLHSFATATGQASNSIFLQLELNGVSRLGSNPLDVLKLNIPGYVKSSEQPVALPRHTPPPADEAR